jgi:hypothetical protein
MTTTQSQLEQIARECAIAIGCHLSIGGITNDDQYRHEAAQQVLTAANRIAEIREQALTTADAVKFATEFIQSHGWNQDAIQELSVAVIRYAAIKVRESGAVEGLEHAVGVAANVDAIYGTKAVAKIQPYLTALRAIIKEGTPKNT